MKLLLTSNGVTNDSIAMALEELTGRPANGTKLAFVPTAADVEAGDKYWLINDLACIKARGYTVDVVDIAALMKREWWLPRLEWADVIFFGGGNVYYLLDRMIESGLADELSRLLETRVYAGISAGSMAASKYVSTDTAELFGEREEARAEFARHLESGLGYAAFYFKPHFLSPDRPERDEPWAEKIAGQVDFPIYFLDDASAIKIDGDKLEVVSKGTWKFYNDSGKGSNL